MVRSAFLTTKDGKAKVLKKKEDNEKGIDEVVSHWSKALKYQGAFPPTKDDREKMLKNKDNQNGTSEIGSYWGGALKHQRGSRETRDLGGIKGQDREESSGTYNSITIYYCILYYDIIIIKVAIRLQERG